MRIFELAITWTGIGNTLLGLLSFIIILGIIVMIHEGGHFFFAKKAGILCYEFSIGMGPIIYSKRFGETLFSIRLFPIGGFVSMAGEEVNSDPIHGVEQCKVIMENGIITKIMPYNPKSDSFPDEPYYYVRKHDLLGTKDGGAEDLYMDLELLNDLDYTKYRETGHIIPDLNKGETKRYFVSRNAFIHMSKKQAYQLAPYERTFAYKPLGQRFLAVVAGPMMNIVLAVIVFFFMGICQGYPDNNSLAVNDIKNSPLEIAGIEEGDEILFISDKDTAPSENQYFKKMTDLRRTMSSYTVNNKYDNPTFQGNVLYVTYKSKKTDLIKTTTVYPRVIINMFELNVLNNKDGNSPFEIVEPVEGSLFYGHNLMTCDVIKSIETSGKVYTLGDEGNLKTIADLLAFCYSNETAKKQNYTFRFTHYVDRNDDGTIKEGSTTEEIEVPVTTRYDRAAFESQDVEVAALKLGFSQTISRTQIYKYLYMPWVDTGKACAMVFKTLWLLITNRTVGIRDLSGFVGIASATVTMVQLGISRLLYWMGLLSANIAIMNLLPLPALDGGRLAFLGYEAITKKRANQKVENIVHTVGFVLLMILFVFVTFNDIIKLFIK